MLGTVYERKSEIAVFNAIGLNPNPQRGLVVDYTSIPLFYGPWTVVSKAGATYADESFPRFDKTRQNAVEFARETLRVGKQNPMIFAYGNDHCR